MILRTTKLHAEMLLAGKEDFTTGEISIMVRKASAALFRGKGSLFMAVFCSPIRNTYKRIVENLHFKTVF